MDCSILGFPVHHQLLELAQTHVHRLGDAIQPSSSPPAFNLSSIREFSNELVLHIRWPKYWSLSFSISSIISPSNEYSGMISFMIDWLDLLVVQGTLKSFLQHHSSFRWVHKDSRISGLEYMKLQFYKTMKNSFAKGLSQITLPSAVDRRSY